MTGTEFFGRPPKNELEHIDGRTLIVLEIFPKATFYIEPWQTGKKFQARFETYIKYSEL